MYATYTQPAIHEEFCSFLKISHDQKTKFEPSETMPGKAYEQIRLPKCLSGGSSEVQFFKNRTSLVAAKLVKIKKNPQISNIKNSLGTLLMLLMGV